MTRQMKDSGVEWIGEIPAGCKKDVKLLIYAHYRWSAYHS